MPTSRLTNRRQFLKTSTAATALAFGGLAGGTRAGRAAETPGRAAGQPKRVGLIGTG